jgi:hypothetical protein
MAAKQAYFKAVEKKKQEKKKDVYMGDYKKVKNDPRVRELEEELHHLRKEWQGLQRKEENKSRISQLSQIKVSAIIE